MGKSLHFPQPHLYVKWSDICTYLQDPRHLRESPLCIPSAWSINSSNMNSYYYGNFQQAWKIHFSEIMIILMVKIIMMKQLTYIDLDSMLSGLQT